ncbi:potassium channel family protein [Gordonia sp. KTR9]|uniref:potassium channel family protein n=1 Tax=Gordonia sp. KTR9 TaxID=337191 RepID=UPI00027DE9A2|nr:potassium channel family protein [Gordonia sp. KTR9]AFR51075.1 Kef-type K+ transport systems, predicted NAD- binding component [Gordonia sp. KTR9]
MGSPWRSRLTRRSGVDDAEGLGIGIITVPDHAPSPIRAIGRRLGIAVVIICTATGVVYLDRDGYSHAGDTPLTVLDCFYYVTVSLSTTGYGDIAPITPGARAVNVFLVTPLRVLFLVVLIGTTLEVLTERSRQAWRIQRWRQNLHNHVVIVGFGTKGRNAARALVDAEVPRTGIVVVDDDPAALEAAAAFGVVTVRGQATQRDVLSLAKTEHARAVIVGAHRDDTAVLITLTARQLNPTARIVCAVRDTDNAALLRRSGADTVVTSSATAGRLLGMATRTPRVVDAIEDLLTPVTGLSIAERLVDPTEIGQPPRAVADVVIGVLRDDTLYRATDLDALGSTDRLLVVRSSLPD